VAACNSVYPYGPPTRMRSSRPTMFLCFVWFSTATSEARLSCSFLFNLSMLISFTAAACCVCLCVAFHTLANEPEPISFSSLQFPASLQLDSAVIKVLNSLMSQACKAMFQEYRSPALLTMQPSAASMQVMYSKQRVSVPY